MKPLFSTVQFLPMKDDASSVASRSRSAISTFCKRFGGLPCVASRFVESMAGGLTRCLPTPCSSAFLLAHVRLRYLSRSCSTPLRKLAALMRDDDDISAGDQVWTPTGAVATVLAIYPDVGEALVQWSNGDRARFRTGHLKFFSEHSTRPANS